MSDHPEPTITYTNSAEPSPLTPEQIVDRLTPVIEAAIARRMEEVYAVLEDLRSQMQSTVQVLDGNDQALVAEIQRLRGSGGEQVAEVLANAAGAWERWVRAEAANLGLKVIVPKVKGE